MKLTVQNEIKYWQSKFRILKDWEINYESKTEYKQQCTAVAKTHRATIYAWGRGRRSKDYIFHEILHICQKEITFYKEYKVRREKEEMYIQDLCQIMRAHDKFR